jgi:invasion protein IalB
MAYTGSRFAVTARVRCAGAATAALTIGLAGFAGAATAQQSAPKKATQPAAAAKKDASAAPPAGQQAPWVKLCENATATGKDKEGKETKKDFKICMTLYERLDANTGMTIVSAGIRQVEGQDKQYFLIMVPTAVLVKPGMRAAFLPKEEWEKAIKNEKIDDKKVKEVRLDFTACHPGGCTAEIEAPADLMKDLKTSGGFMVTFAHVAGQAVAVPVSLTGFEKVLTGPPADNKAYTDARRQLMAQIAQRQQQLVEEYKKHQEDQQKAAAAGQPPPAALAPGQQPAAPVKAATPPAQKK